MIICLVVWHKHASQWGSWYKVQLAESKICNHRDVIERGDMKQGPRLTFDLLDFVQFVLDIQMEETCLQQGTVQSHNDCLLWTLNFPMYWRGIVVVMATTDCSLYRWCDDDWSADWWHLDSSEVHLVHSNRFISAVLQVNICDLQIFQSLDANVQVVVTAIMLANIIKNELRVTLKTNRCFSLWSSMITCFLLECFMRPFKACVWVRLFDLRI